MHGTRLYNQIKFPFLRLGRQDQETKNDCFSYKKHQKHNISNLIKIIAVVRYNFMKILTNFNRLDNKNNQLDKDKN